MAFWTRDRKDNESETPRFLQWDMAKKISPLEGDNPDQLPLGWYIYKKGYRWFAIKPNEKRNGFLFGSEFQSPEDAQKWLGIPIPSELLNSGITASSLERHLAERNKPPASTSSSAAPQPASVEHIYHEAKPKKAAPNRTRSISMSFRLTPTEYDLFSRKAEEAGLSKTDYLLQAVTEAQITPRLKKGEAMPQLLEMNEELKSLRAELGRQGGLLKMVVQPNKGQRPLHPEEWDILIQTIQDFAKNKKRVEKTMEKINGYFKA